MQIQKEKTAGILIAILIISIGASITLLPSASAHTPPQNLPTNAYIVPLPDPIGVGQSTLIYMWLNRVYGYYPGENRGVIGYAAVNNDYRFHNYKLTITDPDGEVTVKTFDTVNDPTSNQGYSFTPSKAGTYKLLFEFPGQAYNASGGGYNTASVMVNDYYMPSSSNTTLTVQQDPIIDYPSSYPLPQEYWTRPIYGENPEWWTISSNWLGTGAPGYGGFGPTFNLGGNGEIFYAGDTVGPLTSHIMWTRPLQDGGIVGGNKFDIQGNAWFEGSAYNQRYQNPIIVAGKIYFHEPISFTGSNSGPLDCVDLRTGELIWSRTDLPAMSFALVWDHEDPNQHGVFPAILVSASGYGAQTWRLFDADTGYPLFNVTGVPAATGWAMSSGPSGEQLRYVLQNNGSFANPSYVLARWNSTKLWNYGVNPFSGGSLLSPSIINASNNALTTAPNTAGATLVVDGSVMNPDSPQNKFDWAVPAPWRDTMTSATIVGVIDDDIMLIQNGTLPSQGATFMGSLSFSPYSYTAISLKPESRGQILWTKTYDPPAGNLTVLLAGMDPVNRVFVENLREAQQFVGYSLDNGNKLWTTEPQADMDYYGSQASGSLANTFAYGRLYSSAYAGIVYCYDTATGQRLWTYGNGGSGNSTYGGFQAPGNYPTFVNAIGNDVVYLVTSEHTVEMPIFKGAVTRAINATTGAEIWTLSSYVTEFFTTSFAVADGFATWFNSYDNSVYTVGRGPSALTVQAPGTAIELGRSLVISGKVIDTSSGTHQAEQAGRFPYGVPVSSDASMTEWMAYVYQQKPLPSNFTGVPVSLDVVDANGNYRNIGTATTDASGTFTYRWTPDIEGAYTLIATFHGTNGYWPSYAEAGFAVDSAAATPAPTQAPIQSIADLYFVPAIAGLFVLLVVALLLIVLVLRKRP